jgi:two-component system, cell cycle sensor histidine kinase PleC
MRMETVGEIVPDFHPVTEMGRQWRAGSLSLPLPVFSETMTCAEASERFRQFSNQVAAAIVSGEGRVVGLVNRLKFLARYAQPYVPELFGRRPVLTLANEKPFVIDEDTPVVELATIITFDHPEALRECFVVTRSGRYLGIGTCEALVRSKVSLLTIREKQLHKALLDAQEANRSKSAFLALMSHELRTPLNAIIGFSEIINKAMFGPHSNPRYGEYAKDIHDAGRHLLNLINDILDLSKAESGRMELYSEPIYLPDFLADCLRFVTERARAHAVALQCSVPEGFPQLHADELRLRQILLNLLSNAVKFTPEGGQVSVQVRQADDGGIVVGVKDTGIGMAPESIPLALEPFRQIASPLSRKVEGTGLGLSLVKTMAELHGGTLSIQSALKKGTLVEVHFPPSRTIDRSTIQ